MAAPLNKGGDLTLILVSPNTARNRRAQVRELREQGYTAEIVTIDGDIYVRTNWKAT